MTTDDQIHSQVKNHAYRLLAMRNRTSRELRDRLGRHGFPPPIIEDVLQELQAEGYLDDCKYALGWARYRLEKKPLGRRRLAWELRQRGVSSETIAEVLHELYAEFDEAVLAERAIRKRFLGVRGLQSPIDQQRCSRHLISLGFEAEMVATVIANIVSRRPDCREEIESF
jgi:regulatory protein